MPTSLTPIEIELDNQQFADLSTLASIMGRSCDEIVRYATQALLANEGLGVFLTTKQAAAVLRVSVSTIHRLTKLKKNPLPAIRISPRKTIFYAPELRLWAKTQ